MKSNFININYFLKSEKIRVTDFLNEDKTILINEKFILSLSELEVYKPFFTIRESDITYYLNKEYALLTMVNSDKYYIKKESYRYLFNTLTNKQSLNKYEKNEI